MARKQKTVEEELLKLAGLKSSNGSQASLKKVLDACQKAIEEDEELWEALSEEAQEWINKAQTAADKKPPKPLPPLVAKEEDAEEEDTETEAEDEDEAEADEAEAEDEEEDDVTTKKKSKKKVVAKKKVAREAETPKAKTAKKASARDNGGGKKAISPRRQMKMLIVKKPTISVETLIEKFGDQVSKLTITSIRSDTRDTLRVLVDAGILDMKL